MHTEEPPPLEFRNMAYLHNIALVHATLINTIMRRVLGDTVTSTRWNGAGRATQAAEFYRNPTAVTRRRRVLILTRIALIDDHNGFQVSGTKIRYSLRNLIRRNYIPCTFEGNKHILTSYHPTKQPINKRTYVVRTLTVSSCFN